MTPLIIEIRVYGDRLELIDYDGKMITYRDVHEFKIDDTGGRGYRVLDIHWGRIVQRSSYYLHEDCKIIYDGCVTIEEES